MSEPKKPAKKTKPKETAPKKEKAPDRMLTFAAEYIVDWNGTQAAIRAGYSPKTADMQASRMLRNVKVRTEIERLLEDPIGKRNEIRSRVIGELEKIAYDPELREDTRMRAMEMLGKHAAMFTEKIEHVGLENMPGIVILPDKLSTEEWEKKYGHD